MGEAVLCSAKSDAQLRAIVSDLAAKPDPALLTRLSPEQLAALPDVLRGALTYDEVSATATLGGSLPERDGRVAVIAAGTSDQRVAAEASQTLAFNGVGVGEFVDVGVAGLWRLEARLDEIRSADIAIVVAGMDAALVSVVGGLVAMPVVAVPTSVGYGVAADGHAALNAALASCAQGITVVNIDNGFGAACAAIRMLSLLGRPAGAGRTGP